MKEVKKEKGVETEERGRRRAQGVGVESGIRLQRGGSAARKTPE